MTVRLTSWDGVEFSVFVAKPDMPPKAAVIVLQEIYGVNPHIQEVAEGFAKAGYLALAPATFHRVKHGVSLGYTPEDMKTGMMFKSAVDALPEPGVMADIEETVKYAAKTCGGKVGIVGYCWGGLLTWRAAEQVKGLSAAVMYYGGGSTSDAERGRKPACPVLAHFAEKDHWIPQETVDVFQKLHPEVELHRYAADHGFNCDQRGAYNETAAKLARERTMAFFAKHLA